MVSATPHAAAAREPAREPDYKRLLYLCEYPPSTAAGAPIIARQLLREYDMDRLDVLCCAQEYNNLSPMARETLLPCRHTLVPALGWLDFSPRRYTVPMRHSLHAMRMPYILRRARRIVRERGIEALFTIPWHTEFTVAALLLHRETGLPLYVFETDDWEQMNVTGLPGYLARRYHGPLIREAEQFWVISPHMGRKYAERFGVEGEFLYNFVDVDAYVRASRAHASERAARAEAGGPIRLVYTGSINHMFADAMQFVCDRLNEGMTVRGRPVELLIYSGSRPEPYLGPHVRYAGFVKSDDVPEVLADADATLIAVSFSQEPFIRELVETCLYTKTIDYLASARPLLIVAPPYTAEVEYFGDVGEVVPELDADRLQAAVERLVFEDGYGDEVAARGVELVRRRHSLDSVHALFLKHFERAGSPG